jgi:diacylglycerol kinase (ATP)
MLVYLNGKANGGNALRKWNTVARHLSTALPNDWSLVSEMEALDRSLEREADVGDGRVIAVGGDGTVHLVVNRLMAMDEPKRARLTLGAVGAGSSNDFHKPVSDSSRIEGVPVRLDGSQAVPHNVGQADFRDESGNWRRRYFVINASLGVLAAANRFFSLPGALCRWLKRHCMSAAIGRAGIKALFCQSNVGAEIATESERIATSLTNLSVLINPHISGSFKVDVPVSPSDDSFAFALCEDMHVARRVKTFAALSRCRFQGLPGTRTGHAAWLEIKLRRPTPLELDGEVCMTDRVRFQLLKGALRVCAA